jgi:hypothetical protein
VAGAYTLRATSGKLDPDVSNTFTIASLDVTSNVTVARSKVRVVAHPTVSAPGMLVEVLTLTNTSSQMLTGPLTIVLHGLPEGTHLVGATGSAADGQSLRIPGRVTLAPGRSLTVRLRFTFTDFQPASGGVLPCTVELIEGI